MPAQQPLSPAQRQQRQQLRRQCRQQRRQLTPGQRRRASRRVGPALTRALQHRPARHIALYLANDGELDLLPGMTHPRLRHASTYLPWLDPLRRGHLKFRLWQAHHAMTPNQYGIAEPARALRGRALWALDVILLPAVAFDRAGYRMGMGGGYYDRTLADLQRRPRQPMLVAVGYDFQCVEEGMLPVAPWDQPVDRIVTAGSG
ncbi:MAG: 5-formyltetrahydrofolate cyclo-ligase [Pseudomonadota bacterium]|uniref:5-formyltetrahydrofolate cyclo-ligase n=1 Tax=Alcanivorax sp. TaxID=1872427 RepID=UPI0025C702BB|nr:5-formyltetrahydrofolate cyclo-ligase [Alcanivorax sp.]MEE3320669.1 5-formyltetrahydrofolate cyclo-ligase [Pseudomonadota bacterium]